jgi:hypothetical protein
MLFLPMYCIRGLIPIISAIKGGVLNPSTQIKFRLEFHSVQEKPTAVARKVPLLYGGGDGVPDDNSASLSGGNK